MLKTENILDLFSFYKAKTISTREEADKLFEFINTLDISSLEVNHAESKFIADKLHFRILIGFF